MYARVAATLEKPVHQSFILEPCGRNTAPAIAAATLYAQQVYGEKALLLVMPCDHLIADTMAFEKAVKEAVNLARAGKIVTFGVVPNTPATGYGYINYEGDTIVQFIEKPSQKDAQRYVNAGNFLWNAGIFCFSAGTMLQEFSRHAPDILRGVEQCFPFEAAKKDAKLTLNAQGFAKVKSQSVDYAIMEKTTKGAVVACDMRWSDIGDWTSLAPLLARENTHGAYEDEDIVMHDSHNCTVVTHGRTVGLVGVRDMIVVDSPEALLVAGKDSAQGVKKIYEKLKDRGGDSKPLPPFKSGVTKKAWGSLSFLAEKEKYSVKVYHLDAHQKVKITQKEDETVHWAIMEGAVQVQGENSTVPKARALTAKAPTARVLTAGDFMKISTAQTYYLENQTAHEAVFIETRLRLGT